MQQGEDGHLELSVLPLPSRIFVPGVRGQTQEGEMPVPSGLGAAAAAVSEAACRSARRAQGAVGRAHLGRLTGARVFPMLHPSN